MRILAALCGLLLSLSACADTGSESPKYQAGVHYTVLEAPVRTSKPDKIEVTEVFWYGCGHCYHLEPVIKPWKQALPEDVNFVLSPAMWNKPMETHAQAFYAAQALGVADTMHEPLFSALNVERKRLATEDELAALFAAQGVDEQQFRKVFNSFGVKGQVRQADARARSYRITGTPELVVEGKYVISTKQAGGQQQMLDVAGFLIEQVRAERHKAQAGN